MIRLDKTIIHFNGELDCACMWCGGNVIERAELVGLYPEDKNDYGVELVFCTVDDHSSKWLDLYDLKCAVETVSTFCRRAVLSEGYDAESRMFSGMEVDISQADILFDMLRGCKK